jgi:hypothetical protein
LPAGVVEFIAAGKDAGVPIRKTAAGDDWTGRENLQFTLVLLA